MVANDVASLVTDAMPYVTAAAGAYTGAVTAKASDEAATATVNIGVRILEHVFGRKEAVASVPKPLTDFLANPGKEEFLATLKTAIQEALERDAEILTEVRAIVPGSPRPDFTLNARAGRDFYMSYGNMTVKRLHDYRAAFFCRSYEDVGRDDSQRFINFLLPAPEVECVGG